MVRQRYDDGQAVIYCADARYMTELPNESVQCVVTSPPYWGLRKYSGKQELIWGDGECEHEWVLSAKETGCQHWNTGGQVIPTTERVTRDGGIVQLGFCALCGAWKGQYGLEPTPEMYIEHTLEFLREIRRVLRKDGVVFWNIGDSYAGSGSPGGDFRDGKGGDEYLRPYNRLGGILKPKDLCLIPFRVAIAAQQDGWWVRSVIIWSKPNPMPESVQDRPTESHEYVLMLTKSGTSQYWTHRDLPGTRQRPKPDYRWINQLTEEEVAIAPPDWKEKIVCPQCDGSGEVEGDWLPMETCSECNGRGKVKLWRRINLWQGHDYYWDADAVRESSLMHGDSCGSSQLDTRTTHGLGGGNTGLNEAKKRARELGGFAGRNIRTVWEIPTQPYPEAHFAVFPEALPEKCIMAATPPKCCAECGAPWERVVEKKPSTMNIRVRDAKRGVVTAEEGYRASEEEIVNYGKEVMGESRTIDWRPTCSCNADTKPALVLDPFSGVGTTGKVAKRLGRHAVLYDISEQYCQLAVKECRQMAMPLQI